MSLIFVMKSLNTLFIFAINILGCNNRQCRLLLWLTLLLSFSCNGVRSLLDTFLLFKIWSSLLDWSQKKCSQIILAQSDNYRIKMDDVLISINFQSSVLCAYTFLNSIVTSFRLLLISYISHLPRIWKENERNV